MEERPEPTCADCIAFIVEDRDAEGRVCGVCRFRPELSRIDEQFPYCHLFQVRRSRADKVKVPAAAKRRGPRGPRRGTATAAPKEERPTLDRPTTGDTSGEITMDRDGLKQVLRELLSEETIYGYPEMGKRWDGGTLVIKPADEQKQPKELPLETFFNKIVMIRDRLRVLEAKINGHETLSKSDKIELQGYISKAYGTLTTFNVLFRDKQDAFSSK